jgi:hypothetical protein
MTPDPNNITIVSPRPGLEGLPLPTTGEPPTIGACDRCGATIWAVELPSSLLDRYAGHNPVRRICKPCDDIEEAEAAE